MSELIKGIGLQFFAESDGDAGSADGEGNGQGTGTEKEQHQDQPKTFTQEEVSRMLANEKRQGKQSILKELGLNADDKDAVKKAKEVLESQKSQAEKDAEALKAAQTAKTEAESRATLAERKITAITEGCKPEFVEEVVALAGAKVTDTVDYAAALKAVKEKCPSFFAEEDTGTGSGQSHKRQQNNGKAGTFGSRLAEKIVNSETKNNPYFK